MGIEPLNNQSWPVSLPLTARPVKVSAKMEDVVADYGSESSLELSSTASTSNKKLHLVMKYMCMVCDVSSQWLLEDLKQYRRDIIEGSYAVISDQRYCTCQKAELSNSEHDLLGLQDLSHSVKWLSALMDLSAHEHMLYSALEFKTWNKLLVGEVKEEMKHEQVLESEEPAFQRTIVLEVEVEVLHNVRQLGIYNSDLGEQRLQHISVAECAIPF